MNILKFKLFEDAQEIQDELNATICSWKDEDARAFGYINGKLLIAESHYQRHCDLNPMYRREDMTHPGRLWLEAKIITFWVHPDKDDFKRILKEIKERIADIDWSGWKVEVIMTDEDMDGKFWRNWQYCPKLIPIEDYTGSLKWSEKTLKKCHTLPAEEKHQILMDMGVRSKIVQAPGISPAEYKDITTKYKFTENVKRFNLFESPDNILNKELGLDLDYEDKDAIPFGYQNNIFVVGVPRKSHYYSIGNRDKLKFPGRIWKNSKVISFWNPQPTKEQLDKIVNDLNNNWNRFDKRRKPINVDGEWSIEIDNKLTKIKDYQGSDVIIPNIPHEAKPMEKEILRKQYNIKQPEGIGSKNPKNKREWRWVLGENYANKMTKIAQDELKNTPGGTEYFDKIDAALKLPQNLDVIKTIFQQIQKEQGTNFNLILTGGFGEWIHSLIKKGVLKVPGNLVTSCGSIRGGNDKLGKTTKGKDVDIIHKKDDIDNQKFIMFDDSFYSGSTKKALEDYLKKFGSEISKTYVLYDGSDVKDPNRTSLYRYYDHHTGTKLGVDLLIDYLYSLSLDIPKDSVRDKILKGEINTINDIIVEVNKILVKFGKSPIDKLTHKETSNVIKSFEAFEYEAEHPIQTSRTFFSIHFINSCFKFLNENKPKMQINKKFDNGLGIYSGQICRYITMESGETYVTIENDFTGRIIRINFDRVGDDVLRNICLMIQGMYNKYEFQKEFLEKYPNEAKRLNIVGVNPKISEEYDYLWSGNEMGLL